MKYTLLLQASQKKTYYVTFNSTLSHCLTYLLDKYLLNVSVGHIPLYHYVTFIPIAFLLFCSTLVSFWLIHYDLAYYEVCKCQTSSLIWMKLCSEPLMQSQTAKFLFKVALVENVVAMGIPSVYIPFFAKKSPSVYLLLTNGTLFTYLVTLHPF